MIGATRANRICSIKTFRRLHSCPTDAVDASMYEGWSHGQLICVTSIGGGNDRMVMTRKMKGGRKEGRTGPFHEGSICRLEGRQHRRCHLQEEWSESFPSKSAFEVSVTLVGFSPLQTVSRYTELRRQ